jgi:hypothetical protein
MTYPNDEPATDLMSRETKTPGSLRCPALSKYSPNRVIRPGSLGDLDCCISVARVDPEHASGFDRMTGHHSNEVAGHHSNQTARHHSNRTTGRRSNRMMGHHSISRIGRNTAHAR